MENLSRRYPFDLIDLFFILMAPNHWGLILFCILQYLLRHNAALWQAIIEVANETDHPIIDSTTRISPISSALMPALENITPPPPKRLPPPREQKVLPKPQDASHPPKRNAPQTPPLPTQKHDGTSAAVYASLFDDNGKTPDQTEELFNRIHSVPHLAVIGETNAGKSTLLNYLAHSYIARGELVIVLDPHSSPDKWPSGAKVYGAGLDYNAIGDMLGKLSRHMKMRYQDIASGKVRECEHPKIHVIADEWRAIKSNIRTAGEMLGQLITEARKANIRIILGAHSHYLTGLGVDDSAIRESLALAFLRIDKYENRSILIDKDTYPMPDLTSYSWRPAVEGILVQQPLPHIPSEAEEKVTAFIKKRAEWTTVREIVQNVRGMETTEARAVLEKLCADGTFQKREIRRAERYGLPAWTVDIDSVDVDKKESVDVGVGGFSLMSTP